MLKELWEKLKCLRTIESIIGTIEVYVRKEFKKISFNKIEKLNYIIDIINKYNGIIPIPCLADELGMSIRQLQRIFKKHSGMTPKQFCKLIRINSIVQEIGNFSSEKDILDLVYRYGFVDQSHLIKEFKHYTGMTPGIFTSDR